jgi:hypothetical protein
MPRGGYRPGAGRPKGAKNKKPASGAVRDAISDLQAAVPGSRKFDDAVQFAMDVINDTSASMDDKVRLAIAVMPYQRPKLADIAPGES